MIAKHWEKFKYSTTGAFYSSIQKNELRIQTARWMNLKCIMLTEIAKSERLHTPFR